MKTYRTRLEQSRAAVRLRGFFYGKWYPPLVALAALISYITGGELVVWTCYVVCACLSLLLCPDLMPVLPPTLMATFCLSIRHAPKRPTNCDWLFTGWRLWMLVGFAVVLLICYLLRMFLWGFFAEGGQKKPALRWFLLPLTLCLLLNGAGQGDWTPKNLIFGVITAFCWCFLYLTYVCGIRHGAESRNAFLWCCLCVGWLLLSELAYVYLANEVIVGGSVVFGRIQAGWGIHNNVGAMLAMMIPPAFGIAATKRWGWAGYLTAVLLLVGVVLTNSRGSLLVGGAAFLAGIVLLCLFGENKRFCRIATACLAVCILLAAILLREKLAAFLPRFRTAGWGDSGRFRLWKKGWNLFLAAPLFGRGFAAVPFKSYAGDLFPGYMHNTLIELLGACGAGTVAAYLAYRVRSALLFFRKPTLTRTWLGLTLLVLIGTSLLDNHLFNVYPCFFYAAALALAEGEGALGRQSLPAPE